MTDHTTQEIPQEIWNDIPGYESLYQVSNLGRVRSLDRRIKSRWPVGRSIKGRVIIQGIDMAGYYWFRLSKDGAVSMLHTHNAVMQTFVGQRPYNHDIHHINGDNKDNRLENLCYMLESEHIRTIHPNPPKGEKSPNAKVTENDVRTMRKLYEAGTHAKRQIARMYGLSQKSARNIIERKSWKHVE
jgi:hypothetical protein